MNEWKEFDRIYLEPRCEKCGFKLRYEDRLWCNDRQEECSECGMEWIEFIRAPSELKEQPNDHEAI